MTFETLLKECSKTAYPEPETPLHTQLTQQLLPEFEELLPRNAKVLDLGCGSGLASRMFRERGHEAVPVSILQSETYTLRNEGFTPLTLDQHHIDFIGPYDAVWARHILEHSPVPFLVLLKIFDRLKPGGLLYLEVPAPETACHHESNPNHWSVLTFNSWLNLLYRAGFVEVKGRNIQFQLAIGDDLYFQFIARKPCVKSTTSENPQTDSAGESPIQTL